MSGRGALAAIALVPLAAAPVVAACIVQVVGGEAHTLALDDEGQVWAWGENQDGQLGDGTNVDSLVAVQPKGLPPIAWLGDEQEGEHHSLALAKDGRVWAWGLGYGNVPLRVPGLSSIVDIAGTEDQSLALRSDGTVWQWTGMSAAVQVELADIVQIAGGADVYNGALKRDGTVWTWAAFATTAIQVQTPSGSPLGPCIDVSGGGSNFVAIDTAGDVWAWGPFSAVKLPGPATHVVGGEGMAYALLRDGTVRGWRALVTDMTTEVPGLQDVVWISSGDSFGLAIEADGSVWGWGDNFSGQLGDGTRDAAPVPVRARTGPPDPVPGDQGNVLKAVKRLPDVWLDFTGAMAPRWRLYRDDSKPGIGQSAIQPDVTVPGYLDPGIVLAPPALDFYRLKGLSRCLATPGP